MRDVERVELAELCCPKRDIAIGIAWELRKKLIAGGGGGAWSIGVQQATLKRLNRSESKITVS